MQLCYVNYSASWGGLEMYSADLFERIVARGHDVEFFVEAGSPLAGHLERAGHASRFVRRKSRKYLDPGGFRTLRRRVLERGVQLVHTFRSADIFHSALGTRGLGDRRPALLHHLQMLPGRPRRDLLHSRVYRHLDRVLTLTDQMRERVCELWPVPADRVETLYYGLDPAPPTPHPERRARARARLELPVEGTLVGLVGQICEIKGQRFVLDALAPRIDAGELDLAFVGQAVADAAGTAYHRALVTDAGALARPGGVHLFGFRDDALDLMPAFDVFILGSRVEAFGRVVIEAMAAGCLTIASRAGGVPEIIDDGLDGWLYRPLDRADLRAVLGRVLALDEAGREAVRRRAQEKVARQFSMQRHLEEIERIYGELAPPARPRISEASRAPA